MVNGGYTERGYIAIQKSFVQDKDLSGFKNLTGLGWNLSGHL